MCLPWLAIGSWKQNFWFQRVRFYISKFQYINFDLQARIGDFVYGISFCVHLSESSGLQVRNPINIILISNLRIRDYHPTTIEPTTYTPSTTVDWTTEIPETTSTTEPTPTPYPKPGLCTAPDGAYNISHWPPAYPYQESIAKCPDGFEGVARWYCEPNGKFRASGPIFSCKQPWIDETKDAISKVNHIDRLITESDSFKEKLKKKPVKYTSDLKQSMDVVKTIQQQNDRLSGENSGNEVLKVTTAVVESCSTLVDQSDAWKNGQHSDRVKIAESMLKYVQYSGVTLGCTEVSQCNYFPHNQPLCRSTLEQETNFLEWIGQTSFWMHSTCWKNSRLVSNTKVMVSRLRGKFLLMLIMCLPSVYTKLALGHFSRDSPNTWTLWMRVKSTRR